jgi:hypothetical protein
VTRQLQPCGTDAGYKRHRYNGDPRCGPCWAAHSATNSAANKARQRALYQLAAEHRARFLELLDEQRKAAGL